MKVMVNGEVLETSCTTLAELMETLNYKPNTFATAIDGAFVPREQRPRTLLAEGMQIEVVAPMQGG